MERLRLTDDGFATLYSPEFNQHYHSVRGAMDETQRVYIELGLWAKMQEKTEIHILEIGFGTGLNALVTLLEAQKNNLIVHYTTLEPFPISDTDIALLNYEDELKTDLLQALHQTKWEETVEMNPHFFLTKKQIRLQDFNTDDRFDLVYFDAFAPVSQPELWTEEIFRKIADLTIEGGFLTTYCSKSDVRRALQGAGFNVEKHQGMRGKREVVRAILRSIIL